MNNIAEDVLAQLAEASGSSGVIAMLQATAVLQGRVESALESVGLTGPKYMTLEQLIRAGGSLSLSALADCRKCVRSNITQLVDRLEDDGLVERVNNPDDRRAIRARITDLGHERFSAAAAAIQAVQEELASKLTADQRAGFVNALMALQNP
jgi:DNA-binding MarR family transcriptional regulator